MCQINCVVQSSFLCDIQDVHVWYWMASLKLVLRKIWSWISALTMMVWLWGKVGGQEEPCCGRRKDAGRAQLHDHTRHPISQHHVLLLIPG